MGDKIIETLKQLLEAEEASEVLTKLPSDTYVKMADYTRKLRRSTSAGGDDLASRLVRKQIWLVEAMAKQFLRMRLRKAITNMDMKDLLPEERHIRSRYTEFERRTTQFIEALANGQPSFFAVVQNIEMERMTTVRFVRPLGEIVGFDLRKYGPFAVHDTALIPAGNADALIDNGDATTVLPREAF